MLMRFGFIQLAFDGGPEAERLYQPVSRPSKTFPPIYRLSR
jgi:hypothetical protein